MVLMRKLFLGLIIVSVLFTGNISSVKANDIFTDPLADSADQFIVIAPSANQKVKNNVVVSVRAYDNNQPQITGSVELWDSSTCRSSRLGVIASPTTFQSNQTTNNTINWNTTSIADGEYCIKVCLNLKEGNNPYLACNGRRVRVLNTNKAPTITSFPQNLSVYENDPWEYDVNATDADGDQITYRLIQTANFLSIDPQTGLIRRGTPNVTFTGDIVRYDYTIIVAADDNFSGAATQQFVLSILKRPAPVTPSTTPPTNPPTVPEPEPEEVNTAAQITFISPKENQILRGKDNVVQWKIVDTEELQSGVLLYSADGDIPEFTSIFEFTDSNVTSFNWNVSMIPNGKYFLSLSTIDEDGVKTIKASPIFNIQNSTVVEPEPTPGVSLITVTETSPRDEATLNLSQPTISGSFSIVEDLEVDVESFTLKLNNDDFTDSCTVSGNEFVCEIGEELSNGSYQVKITAEDSVGDIIASETTLYISADEIVSFPEEDGSTAPDTITILGITLPRNVVNLLLILCAVTFLLLFIPWILLRIWKRDRDGSEDTYSETDTETKIETDYSSPYGSLDTNNYYLPSSDEPKKEVSIPDYYSEVKTEVNTEVKKPQTILSDYPEPFPKQDVVVPYTDTTTTVTEVSPARESVVVEPTPEVSNTTSETSTTSTVAAAVSSKKSDFLERSSQVERKWKPQKKNVSAKVTADYSTPEAKAEVSNTDQKVIDEYYKYVNPTNPEFIEPVPTDVEVNVDTEVKVETPVTPVEPEPTPTPEVSEQVKTDVATTDTNTSETSVSEAPSTSENVDSVVDSSFDNTSTSAVANVKDVPPAA